MIFEVEKRRFRKGGKVRETRSYYLRYRIGDMLVDRWKSLGVADKQVADKKAHEFIQEKEREAAGILEPQVIRDGAKRPLTQHLEDYGAAGAMRSRRARGAVAQGSCHSIDERLRLEAGRPGDAGFVHVLANESEGLRADVEPLLARDGFLPELDGAGRQNQSESTQVCA